MEPQFVPAYGDAAALQNADFLRQLIMEARANNPQDDAMRLRMPMQGNLGMNAQTVTGAAG